MALRHGDTLLFPAPPVIAAHAAVGGKKEGEGPLAAGFDQLSRDNFFGQKNWEAAEKALQLRAARLCLEKAGTDERSVDLALAGDLQAQCTASNYTMRELDIPFAGLFGACSTMAEALGLGAAFCAGGMAEGVLAMASSHFCAAEREFRTPLNYGAFRTPTSQWTATAAGCCLLRPAGPGVQIRAVTLGRVVDYRVSDITNMGAARAPAAAATLLHSLLGTWAGWAAGCWKKSWKGKGSPASIMRTAAACSTGQTLGSTAAGRAPAAAPASCPLTSCPGWKRGS